MFSYLTGEWILKHSNSGYSVFRRAVFVAIEFYVLALLVRLVLTWNWEAKTVRDVVVDTLPWFGALFGGAYAAFYARFASQWTYLADLYNQILDAECAGAANEEKLEEWKVAFVVDAVELHLARKDFFRAPARRWMKDSKFQARWIALGNTQEDYEAWLKYLAPPTEQRKDHRPPQPAESK